jgi:hypothetical protein
MLRHVTLLIRVTRIGELGTTFAVTNDRSTLCLVQKDGILQLEVSVPYSLHTAD